ncbi:hypothetical protein V5799_029973 [Amblyomma americanum]|uniref:Uncharacterized protein n=1 Tax=Amblyomma americanum TaxID=6943 RepID=A0AAQ4EPI4_AMBAM
MLATIYKPSHSKNIFMVLVLGPLLYLYHHDVQRLPFQLRRRLTDALAFKDSNCTGMRVVEACGKEELVKVLFVVDTVLENRSNRRFARNAYAKRSFARPIHWLTVFRMMGNVTDEKGELAPKARSECRAFGDIVVHRNGSTGELLELEVGKNSSTYLQFVPWILDNCPNVDLVVFMQDNVIPNPFYLPNYRVMHMDHRPQVIHCHSFGGVPTSLCKARSVVMAKKLGLKLFASKASAVEDELVLFGLEARDMGSYLSVDDNMTMLYTTGAVVFYAFPEGLNVTMMSLWEEVISAPQNSPDYLRL